MMIKQKKIILSWKKEDKKMAKEVKETIFVKKLFDDQGPGEGTGGFFNQKLFPNNYNINNNNNELINKEGKSLFGGLFTNNNFTSSFDNKKREEQPKEPVMNIKDEDGNVKPTKIIIKRKKKNCAC